MVGVGVLVPFAATSFALAATPGPSWIYLMSRTTSQGRAAGIIAILGNAAGICTHVTAATLGLSAIFNYSATAFDILKWIGAGYLIFLSIKTWRGRINFFGPSDLAKKGLSAIFLEAAFINILNPKVALFMLALLPQFVDSSRGSVGLEILMLGFIHVTIATSVLLSVLFAATRLSKLLSQSSRFQSIFRTISGSLLFLIGIRLALTVRP